LPALAAIVAAIGTAHPHHERHYCVQTAIYLVYELSLSGHCAALHRCVIYVREMGLASLQGRQI
jgi:hypothetical protein